MSSDGAARSLREPDNKPAVTEAHQRAAFAQMGWVGWTYEQAMADDVRSRVLMALARSLRNREWRASLGLPVPHAPAVRTQHNFFLPPGTPRIF